MSLTQHWGDIIVLFQYCIVMIQLNVTLCSWSHERDLPTACPPFSNISLWCFFSGLPFRLRLPFPCAAGAVADAEGGGGAGNCDSLPSVWWRRPPPVSEAAPVCSAPAAGKDPMAQHPQHLPESQSGASEPGTPAHHCENLRMSLNNQS